MKLSTMAAAAAVLTVAAGAASQAAEQPVAPETTASVPAITVSADGELQYSSEFQRIADYDRGAVDDETILTLGACGIETIAPPYRNPCTGSCCK